MQNNDARNEIMASIRQNLAKSLPFDAVHGEHHAHQETPKSAATVSLDLPINTLTKSFQESLVAIGGNCTIVANISEATAVVQTIIDKAQAKRIAISDSDLVLEVSKSLKTESDILQNASAKMLFETDLGITSAQFGIAETGTLVLESDREFHRLTSLVPPIHVCLLKAETIKQTLGETLEILEKDLSRTVTFITGPSRTSDIELTLAIGVHGPAELHVIIVE